MTLFGLSVPGWVPWLVVLVLVVVALGLILKGYVDEMRKK